MFPNSNDETSKWKTIKFELFGNNLVYINGIIILLTYCVLICQVTRVLYYCNKTKEIVFTRK